MAVLHIRNSSGKFEEVQSLNGKTAYQAAKEGGYTGTESEFNTKLAQPEYSLPIATESRLGGVKPVTKSSNMTRAVGVDESGGLWTQPIELDATLTQAGQAADAAKTGEAIGKLKNDLSNKITKFYASNQGETHITDSDNGKIMDMVIYGKSSQDGTPSPENPVEIKSVVNPMVRVFGGTLGNKFNNKQINWLIDNMNIWHDNTHFVFYDEYGANGSIRLITCVYTSDTNNYPCTIIDIDGNINTARYQISDINVFKNTVVYCNMIPITDTNNVSMVIDVDSNKTVGLPNNYQTVTLPYTLKAIPVESGGNVTIDGRQYIADYVDVERGKLVRIVDSSKLDNTQSIVDKTEWLLSEPQEIDLTTEEITALKALVTYYPTTNISISSEQLDGYAVFNYQISIENGWNYVKQQIGDAREYIYDMDLQSAEAYVNSEYAVALTELEV